MRLSRVSVDVALWAGPRNDVQSWVTASFASGPGFVCTRACAAARMTTACAISAWMRARRDIVAIRWDPTRPFEHHPSPVDHGLSCNDMHPWHDCYVDDYSVEKSFPVIIE